jgi:hypothetical protein
VRDRIETVALEGQNLHVAAREPLGVEPRLLALAAAIRVFERYPVLTQLTLSVASRDVVVSRDEVLQLLGPEGFAPLNDRERFRQVLARGLARGGDEAAS